MRRAAMGLTAATSGCFVLFLSMTVAQSRNGVTYISAQMCAVRGSTVDIRCTCRQPSTVKRRPVPVENILWFTEMQEDGPVDLRADSKYSGRVQYRCHEKSCTLTITNLRESDSAEYKFRFKHRRVGRFKGSPGVTLSVTDPDLRVQVRRSVFTWAQQFCQSTCHLPDRPSYIWYKNGQKIQEETSSSYSDYVDPAELFLCCERTCRFLCSSSVSPGAVDQNNSLSVSDLCRAEVPQPLQSSWWSFLRLVQERTEKYGRENVYSHGLL
ncbi:uncharacterized protein LOC144533103 [Sander vitreus]